MAVERLTDYTRRIWTGLAADSPDPDMQAGDVIYYMDTSTCSIITGIPAPGSIDTKDLPDIGGGELMDEVQFTLRNRGSSTIEIYYATRWRSLGGYAATTNVVSSGGTVRTAALLQYGFIIIKFNANPSRINYGTEVLPIEKAGSYVVKFPYMGNDEEYQVYF